MLLLVDITSIRDSTPHWCSLSLAQFWQNAGAAKRLPPNLGTFTSPPGRSPSLQCRRTHPHSGTRTDQLPAQGTGRAPGAPVRSLCLASLGAARRGVLGFPAGGGFALVVHSFAGDEELGAELYGDDNDDNTNNIGDACIDDISCDDNSHDDAAFLVGGGFGRPLMACRNSR